LHSLWQVGHVGLAAATSLSAFINAILLFLTLRKKGIYQPSKGWPLFLVSLISSVALMLTVLALLLEQFGGIAAWHQIDWSQRLGKMLLLCVSGLGAFSLCLYLFGFRWSDMRGPSKPTSD